MPKKQNISNARLYDPNHAPLNEDESTNAQIWFLTVMAWVQTAKGTDDLPLRPSHFGAIRELIAAAIRQWFMPADARLAAPIPELFSVEPDGRVSYRIGGSPTPQTEALEMLYQCQAALEYRQFSVSQNARRSFLAAIGRPFSYDTDEWNKLRAEVAVALQSHSCGAGFQPASPVILNEVKNPSGASSVPSSPPSPSRSREASLPRPHTPPAFSSLDLAVTRLLPRLKALINDLLENRLTLSDTGTITEASPTVVQGSSPASDAHEVRVIVSGANNPSSPVRVPEELGRAVASTSISKGAAPSSSDSSSPTPSDSSSPIRVHQCSSVATTSSPSKRQQKRLARKHTPHRQPQLAA